MMGIPFSEELVCMAGGEGGGGCDLLADYWVPPRIPRRVNYDLLRKFGDEEGVGVGGGGEVKDGIYIYTLEI